MLARIVELKLGHIKRRVAENHQVEFSWDKAAVDAVMSRATDIESGGRMVDAILSNHVLAGISKEILHRTMNGQAMRSVRVSANDKELTLDVQ